MQPKYQSQWIEDKINWLGFLCTTIWWRTHVTLEVVCLPGLDYIGGVRQAGPVVQACPVVEVIDLDLAFLGQLNCQHVHWQVELGLRLVEILFVQGLTGDLGWVHSQHDQRVVKHTECSDVVAHLLAVALQVLVLFEKFNQTISLIWLHRFILNHMSDLNEWCTYTTLHFGGLSALLDGHCISWHEVASGFDFIPIFSVQFL